MCVNFLSSIVAPKITLRERAWRKLASIVRETLGVGRFFWPIILAYLVVLIAVLSLRSAAN